VSPFRGGGLGGGTFEVERFAFFYIIHCADAMADAPAPRLEVCPAPGPVRAGPGPTSPSTAERREARGLAHAGMSCTLNLSKPRS